MITLSSTRSALITGLLALSLAATVMLPAVAATPAAPTTPVTPAVPADTR